MSSSDRGVLAARLATAAALIGGLLAALFWLPRFFFTAVIAVLVALAAFEWARLCRLGRQSAFAYAALAAALFALPAWTGAAQPVMVLGVGFWVIVAPLWLWRGLEAHHSRMLAAAGLAVLVPAGLAMVTLRPIPLLLVLGLIWVADSAAYFVGRRFGRHKLAPTISPGKTWEGAAGALFAVLTYAIICAAFPPLLGSIAGGRWGAYLAAVSVLGVVSILGDLFESALKRQASVKDSGTLLPGHGGILDRIDSATSTLPFAALLWQWMQGR